MKANKPIQLKGEDAKAFKKIVKVKTHKLKAIDNSAPVKLSNYTKIG